MARNLRALRQARVEEATTPERRARYTKDALAAALDVSPRTYTDLESGVQGLDLERMLQLAHLLDVSPMDFIAPAPGEDAVLIEMQPRASTGVPLTVAKVPVAEFMAWWRGTRPLSSQHRRRWLAARAQRRSEIVFADSRFNDAESRAAGRYLPDRSLQEGKPLLRAPLELPERAHVHMMIEQYWKACAAGEDDNAEQALDAIFLALETGRRRAAGDPDPEAPMWGGRRLSVLGEEESENDRED